MELISPGHGINWADTGALMHCLFEETVVTSPFTTLPFVTLPFYDQSCRSTTPPMYSPMLNFSSSNFLLTSPHYSPISPSFSPTSPHYTSHPHSVPPPPCYSIVQSDLAMLFSHQQHESAMEYPMQSTFHLSIHCSLLCQPTLLLVMHISDT